jgi:hypothetical protein
LSFLYPRLLGTFQLQGAAFDTEEWKGYSEFIVEADSDSGGVELFDDIAFSEPDTARSKRPRV